MFLEMARFPFSDASSETKSLELRETSLVTNRLLFKYVIPSTVKVPLSTMFLDILKLPLIETSEETNRFELRETSLPTNNLLLSETSPLKFIFLPTVKLP